MKRRRLRGVSGLALLPLLAACGYHFAGTAVSLPADIKSVRVGEIENESAYPGVEKNLAFALEDAIDRWGTLDLIEGSERADAVLGGTIRRIELRAVSFDSADLALQYEVAMVADLHLRRSGDGGVVWEVRDLRQSAEYSAVGQVVVTSSSQFQQGTLDAGDLPLFTQVQLAESQQREAVARLMRDFARDAYALMTEGF